MSKCKTKAIQTDLGTFRHNQTYPVIIQAYSEPCVTLTYLKQSYIQNPDTLRTRSIFATLVYSEPRYIQNADIFKIRSMLRTLSNIYDEAFCKNS